MGKSASVDFSSCRQTTSGLEERSQRSRFGKRRLMLLMLKVAIFKKSGRWRRGRGRALVDIALVVFCFAALVDPRISFAEAGQHFVADGAEVMRQFVDADAFADQRHH